MSIYYAFNKATSLWLDCYGEWVADWRSAREFELKHDAVRVAAEVLGSSEHVIVFARG